MTAEEWAQIQHFTPGEMVCRHCQREEMSLAFMGRLDAARMLFGRPIRVTSGFRCADHNTSVGGSPTSSHLTGCAVDLWDKQDPVYRAELVEALWDAGFRQIEVSRDGHVHVMDDSRKPRPFLGIEP